MTKVTIERRKGHIVKVSASGHSGYSEEGTDIICAAVSTLVQTALLGIIQLVGVAAEYERSEAQISYEIPELDTASRRDADMILETMLLGIADLYEGYSDYIELEEKKCL